MEFQKAHDSSLVRLEWLQFRHRPKVSHAPPRRDQDVWDHCARQVEALAGEGTVLVFLPGVGEIERLRERLSVSMPVQVLHGRLAGDAQAAVLEAPSGPRVVLATNVAETSVTIEGVTVVVDAGLERRPSYDPRRHRSRLVTRRISQAESTLAMLAITTVFIMTAGVISIPFGWSELREDDLIKFAASGTLVAGGHYLMIDAFRRGEAGLVAPFKYTSLLWAIIIGYFVFDEVPTGTMMIGACVVIAAGVLIIWRERQLGLQRAQQRKAMGSIGGK